MTGFFSRSTEALMEYNTEGQPFSNIVTRLMRIVAYSLRQADGLSYRTSQLRNPQSRQAERQCSL